jgi:cytochrome oxidase Cu insertion factor (SCO1/SenC/PrrC family)
VTEQPVPGFAARPRVSPRLALTILLVALAVGAGGGALVRVLRSSGTAVARPALPTLHGQAVWKAGARRAPNFVLRDQIGGVMSLASLRGRPVVLTFLDSQCKSSCPIEGRQLGSILRRLPAAQRPALVIVSVDRSGDTPAGIRHALAEWHLTGAWAVHWLNARTHAELASVWRSYGVRVVPTTNDVVHSLALYLIDRRGYERTAYLFPFLPGFVQRDLGRLARERT